MCPHVYTEDGMDQRFQLFWENEEALSSFRKPFLIKCILCVKINKPVAGELYSVGFSLSFFSYDHFVKKPAAASAFTVVSNPDSADLPNGYCLDYKLIKLKRQNREKPNTSDVLQCLWVKKNKEEEEEEV